MISPIIHEARTLNPDPTEFMPVEVNSAFPEGAESTFNPEEKAHIDTLIEAVPDKNDTGAINYWRDWGDRKVYLEGWIDKCLAGTGFPPMEGGEWDSKIEYMIRDTRRTLIEKQEEKNRPYIGPGRWPLIEGGFREFEAGDKDWLYGVTWGVYEKSKSGGANPMNESAEGTIADEQLAKEREAIPFTPTKRLIRDDVLYVEEKDVPHPIYGYAKYHKEYSVTDLRGYRKGYEPRLEIRGIYAPNPEDTFRLQTGKLPPYQPTTTGDKLLAEMRRLGVHKAYRIGNPGAKEPWQMTRKEYVKSAREWRAENMPRLTGRALEDELEHVAAGHKLIVQNALGAGKPVPPEVLADYPDLRTRGGNPGMTPDKWLLKVSIERAPLRVAKQLGYEVHRLSPTDIVDKADYASGFRFRLSKAVPNQPYPQIVMARSEGEVATFLKRQTEAGNPPYLVCQTIELCHRIDAPSKEQAIGLARDKGETDTITELLKDWHVKRKGGNPGNPINDEEIDQIASKIAAKVLAEIKGERGPD